MSAVATNARFRWLCYARRWLIEIVPGPGCPVCVCPEEAVYQAIQLALVEKIILVAFGDMPRVPVNVRKGERSLEQAPSCETIRRKDDRCQH